VSIATESNGGHHHEMGGCRVTPYNVPTGCIATNYLEANTLIPLCHYAAGGELQKTFQCGSGRRLSVFCLPRQCACFERRRHQGRNR
jgi:hypothetical protein